jgi:hypothetical protein
LLKQEVANASTRELATYNVIKTKTIESCEHAS